ncbi:copper resistance CopC family protein [Nocardioides sp. T2.26MG-1]|uniref:copper resistance CopC family protein n=1 Tax=Nocardioides sp. T2.26MG-1 TaxID=3041166 RepID=UPI002477BF66|nr:copper resistance CopC family protein [Nocardioides sp. T2.26MG-1]CAI9419303.1 hypothetical protein HIDPHFAB_03625 [Nocardioides sp. T2.26MG-1]
MTALQKLRRSVVRTLVVALMAALSLLGTGPAQAHTDLVRSSPAEGERLSAPPREIELQFSEDVDPGLSTVVLSRDGSDPVRLEVVGGEQPSVLLATVPAETASATGAWSVGYRVTSVDGHPVDGSVDFIVAGSGPAPRPAGEVPPEEDDPTTVTGAAESRALGTGRSLWQYAGPAILIGALVMLGTLLGLARFEGRSRATEAPPTRGDEAP